MDESISTKSERRTSESDDIFKHVSPFGKYQKTLYFTSYLIVFPLVSQFFLLIFGFGTPGFHCVAPNVTCDPKKCCDGCTSYEFDGPFHSTVSEWNLICDRAFLGATIQSCYFAGMLVGSIATGIVSDAWGRKKCIFICNAIMVLTGFGSAFVHSIPLFAVLRFMVGFGLTGVMITHYIYVMELVGPTKRTAVANMGLFLVSGFQMLFLLIAYFERDWRKLIMIVTLPAALLFPFWKCFPESPRWLIAHDRLNEAKAIIGRFGGKKNKPVNAEVLRTLLENVRRDQIEQEREAKKYTPIDLFRTPKLRKWTTIICFQWYYYYVMISSIRLILFSSSGRQPSSEEHVTVAAKKPRWRRTGLTSLVDRTFVVALVGFGIFIFISQLVGNLYVNYTIMNVITTLKIPLTWILYLRFGRRICHASIMILVGVTFLMFLMVYKESPVATTALSPCGYLMIDCSWTSVYLVTAELFPTVLRNIAQGTGSMTARIGGILAPYVALTAQLPGLSIAFPVVIFSVVSTLAGILMYWIPETLFSPMHQTIEETEAAEDYYGIPCCGKKSQSPRPKSRQVIWL